MPYSLKISLVGLSGSGKTTSLKALCPDAYLLSEAERSPTEDEAKAWQIGLDEKIPTSRIPNFAQIVLDENCKVKPKESYQGKELGEHDIHCLVFDTVGQEIFYPVQQATTQGSDGILYIIDSSVPSVYQKHKIVRAYNAIMSYFPIDTPLCLVYNKQDLVQKRRLQDDDEFDYNVKNLGRAFYITNLLKNEIPGIEKYPYSNASAIEGWGIQEAVENLVEIIMERLRK